MGADRGIVQVIEFFSVFQYNDTENNKWIF